MIEVVAHEMGLDVEDELAGQALRARQHQLGLVGRCRRDLENIAVDVVHGEECRRHAATRVQELPAAQAEVLAVQVGELIDPRLDLLLCSALRGREILAVGNNPSRNRRCRRYASAPATRRCSRSLSHVLIFLLPFLSSTVLVGARMRRRVWRRSRSVRWTTRRTLLFSYGRAITLACRSRRESPHRLFLRERRHTTWGSGASSVNSMPKLPSTQAM